MPRVIPILCGFILVAYCAYESAVSLRKYRRLKRDLAGGDGRARSRFYNEILFFEWMSAILALGALQFDLTRFNPTHLQIGDTAFGRWWTSAWAHMDSGFLAGAAIGIAFSVIGAIVGVRLARQRAARTPQSQQPSVWSNILPDFRALVPVTPQERIRFALVALSAGVCEEIVYRAWLLDALHGVGLSGAILVASASILFGLGHYYQGYAGILITSLVGLVLCGLYVASGTLLVPIIVHALIDLRLSIFPNLCVATEQNVPSSS